MSESLWDKLIEMIAEGLFFDDFVWVPETIYFMLDESQDYNPEDFEILKSYDQDEIKTILYEGLRQWVDRNKHLSKSSSEEIAR